MKELLKKIWNFILKLVALVIGAIKEKEEMENNTVKEIVNSISDTIKTRTEYRYREKELAYARAQYLNEWKVDHLKIWIEDEQVAELNRHARMEFILKAFAGLGVGLLWATLTRREFYHSSYEELYRTNNAPNPA